MAIPTTKVSVAAVWDLICFFSGDGCMGGFSEKVHVGVAKDLTGSTSGLLDATPPDVSAYLTHRRRLLGAGVSLVWARIAKSGTHAPYSLPVVLSALPGLTLNAESPLADCNLMKDAILIRLQGADGTSSSTRKIAAARDAWFKGNALDTSILTNIGTSYTEADAYEASVITAPLALKNYLVACNKLTFSAKKVTDNKYEIQPWSFAVAMKATTIRGGAAFRAFSN